MRADTVDNFVSLFRKEFSTHSRLAVPFLAAANFFVGCLELFGIF